MLKLEVVTPEKKVVETQTDAVTVPTASGDAGILPNHAPLVSALKAGILSYTTGSVTTRLAIAGGFVEVSDNSVSVLADGAETADEIDLTAARAARDAAEKALAAAINQPLDETRHLQADLEAAAARVQLAGGK